MLKRIMEMLGNVAKEVKQTLVIKRKVQYRYRPSLLHYNRTRHYARSERAHRHGWVDYFAIGAAIKKTKQRRAIKRMARRTLVLSNRVVA